MELAAEFVGTPRFQILRRLGAGAMGVVYEALDGETHQRVALKTLRTLGADALLRFKSEFRALADLQHPNLVRFGELFEEDRQWFFTLELIEGVSFLAWVRRPELAVPSPPTEPTVGAPGVAPVDDDPTVDVAPGGRGRDPAPLPPPPQRLFDEKRLRRALAQLAQGLYVLHAAHKVHRDIKPSNLLVTPSGRLVILDFGLVTESADVLRFADDHLVGTASYMAPEQAIGQAVGPAADWYAVGVMLYQALSARLPLTGPLDQIVQLKQVLEPPPVELLAPDAPPDLARLCNELLRIDPKARPDGREVLRRLSVDERALSPGGAPAASFVGRERELSALHAAERMARAGDGAPQVVLLHGESGVGKSALVRRFADEVARGGAVVLDGRCFERESVPYKAVDGVVDALSRYLTTLDTPSAAALLPRDAALLGAVFPVLRRSEAVASAPPEPLPVGSAGDQARRSRLFRALRELLGRLSTARRLVLVIDDLQWADADSLALLADLLHPPDAPRLLLLATVRAGESGGARGLAEIEAELPLATARLAVGALPPDEAARLASLLAGGDTSWASQVAREAAGHPLFIDELVRSRVELGDRREGLKLEDALWSRVQRLDAGARTLLELACVAGGPTVQETAAHAAGSDYAAFADRVEGLRAAHLVRTSGARRTDAVEPYHDRVRDAVLQHLTPEARRGCHRRLALALEASPRADPEALSVHWRGALEMERAASYAVRAADEAAAALAFDRAARLYRQALELRPRDDAEGGQLRARLGDALGNAGRGGEAADAYLEAVPLASASAGLDLQRRAAEQLLRSGRIDRGLEVLRTVLRAVGAELPETPRAALTSLLLRRARLRLRGYGFRERLAAEVAPALLTRVDTHWSVGSGLAIVDTIRGADFQTRGLLEALSAGEPYRVARALTFEAGFSAAAGGGARARTAMLLERASAIADRVRHPHALALVGGSAGLCAFLEGRWGDALALLDRAESDFLHRVTGAAWELHTAQLYALIALAYLGRTDELRRRFPARLREAEERGDLYAATTLRTSLAMMARLAAGETQLARDELAEAMRRWSRQGFHLQHYWNVQAGGLLDLYAGDGAACWRRVEEAWPALSSSLLLRIQVVRAEAHHLRGRAAIRTATGGQQRARLAEAERAAKRLGAEKTAWTSPLADLLRGQVAQIRGDGDGAAKRYGLAATGFDRAAMALHAAAARVRQGEVLAGDEGRLLRARGERFMREQKVEEPARMVAVLAPLP